MLSRLFRGRLFRSGLFRGGQFSCALQGFRYVSKDVLAADFIRKACLLAKHIRLRMNSRKDNRYALSVTSCLTLLQRTKTARINVDCIPHPKDNRFATSLGTFRCKLELAYRAEKERSVYLVDKNASRDVERLFLAVGFYAANKRLAIVLNFGNVNHLFDEEEGGKSKTNFNRYSKVNENCNKERDGKDAYI